MAVCVSETELAAYTIGTVHTCRLSSMWYQSPTRLRQGSGRGGGREEGWVHRKGGIDRGLWVDDGGWGGESELGDCEAFYGFGQDDASAGGADLQHADKVFLAFGFGFLVFWFWFWFWVLFWAAKEPALIDPPRTQDRDSATLAQPINMPYVLNRPLAPHPHPLSLPSRHRPARQAAPHRAPPLPPFASSLPSPSLPDQATRVTASPLPRPSYHYSAPYRTLAEQQPLPGTLLNLSRPAAATSPSALEQDSTATITTTDLHVPRMAPPIPIPRDSRDHPVDGENQAADSHLRDSLSDPDRWDEDLSTYAYRLFANEADDEDDDSASIEMDLARPLDADDMDEEELDSDDDPDDDLLLLQTGPLDPPLAPFLHHISTSEPYQDDIESDLELFRGLRQLRGPHRDLQPTFARAVATRPPPRRFLLRDDRPHPPLRPPARSPTGWHRLRRPGASASGSAPPRRRKFQFDEEGAESGSDTERAMEAATVMRGKEAMVREDGGATWASSFLRPGRSFHGTQNLMNGAPPGVGARDRGGGGGPVIVEREEEWEVRVVSRIYRYFLLFFCFLF